MEHGIHRQVEQVERERGGSVRTWQCGDRTLTCDDGAQGEVEGDALVEEVPRPGGQCTIAALLCASERSTTLLGGSTIMLGLDRKGASRC